jgi:hypothetical protein
MGIADSYITVIYLSPASRLDLKLVITFIALVRPGVKQNEWELFKAPKLLTTVRIAAGEPDSLVRKVSPRWSTERDTFLNAEMFFSYRAGCFLNHGSPNHRRQETSGHHSS